MVLPSRRHALHTDSIARSDLSSDLKTTFVQPRAALRNEQGSSPTARVPSVTGTIRMHLKFGVRAVEHVLDSEQPNGFLTKPFTTPGPTDLLVQVKHAELVSFTPKASGWYAELLVDAEAAAAVRAFDEACLKALSEFLDDGRKRAHIPPLLEMLPGQGDDGRTAARLLAKVSEVDGRLLHTEFKLPGGTRLHAPCESTVTDVYERPPLGACTLALHLMGCWYDLTKTGLHIYLERAQQSHEPDDVSPVAPERLSHRRAGVNGDGMDECF